MCVQNLHANVVTLVELVGGHPVRIFRTRSRPANHLFRPEVSNTVALTSHTYRLRPQN